MDKCIVCDEPTEFIRHTQFASSHPFCEKHAKEEEDFHQSTSYLDWEKLK
jgi:hypothetical protein